MLNITGAPSSPAPLNLALLWPRSRIHRDRLGLGLAVAGIGLILVHMTSHVVGTDDAIGIEIMDALILGGTLLLTLGWVVDLRAASAIAGRLNRLPA